MEAKYNLSSQEYEIMSILWKENREMTLAEIADLLWDAGFEISIGTVKTYLQRIVKKGALIAPKHGHKLMYMPSSSEEAFAQKWTQDFLNKSFRGSLKAFICTCLLLYPQNHKKVNRKCHYIKNICLFTNYTNTFVPPTRKHSPSLPTQKLLQ